MGLSWLVVGVKKPAGGRAWWLLVGSTGVGWMQSALVGKRFGFAPVAKGSRLLVAARCINMQHRFQAFGAPRMAPMFWLSLDMTTSAFYECIEAVEAKVAY